MPNNPGRIYRDCSTAEKEPIKYANPGRFGTERKTQYASRIKLYMFIIVVIIVTLLLTLALGWII